MQYRESGDYLNSFALLCSKAQGSQITHPGCMLVQGSPTPRPPTGTGPWPVRNRAAQQEVSGRLASKASSVFTATPHRSHCRLSSASCQHYGELYNYFIIYYNVIINRNKVHNKCNLLESSRNHPPPVRGNTVFHKTGPWCQKFWGPLC